MTDVLVVGAGPTGLTLAIALVQQGLSVRIIDQLQERMDQSRALALQSRTLELFEKMGVLPAFLAKGRKITGAHFYLHEKTLFQVDLSQLEIPYPFLLSIPQEETEAILEGALLELGVAVERGVTLRGIDVGYTWICGCDGAHSTVRHSLGMTFKGTAFEEKFWLADLSLKTSFPENEASVFLKKEEIVALFPLPKPSWFRVIVAAGQHRGEEVLKELPVEVKERGWSTSFSIHRRLVSHMQRGRCFLLGDAAHIHSPVGGQGLNTGVQDAYNLAWKLALGKEKVLKSFHQERYPVAKAVLRYTTRATHFLLSPRFVKRYLPLIAFLFKKKGVQRRLAEGVSEIALRYRSSPVIDYTPIPGIVVGPGERAPDVQLPDGSRLFTHLCHPLHTLLLWGECKEVSGFIHAHYGKSIRVLQQPFITAYCTKTPSFYLIRPDGYIAFCGTCRDKNRFEAYLTRVF